MASESTLDKYRQKIGQMGTAALREEIQKLEDNLVRVAGELYALDTAPESLGNDKSYKSKVTVRINNQSSWDQKLDAAISELKSRGETYVPSPEYGKLCDLAADIYNAVRVVYVVRGEDGRSYGYYLMRGDGVAVPIITLEEGVTADSVIHETAHHARTTRPKGKITSTAYPQKTDGSFDAKAFSRMSESQKRKAREDEEKATTAEATARSRTDPHPSGYWDRAGGREAYLQDKRTLAGNCKGKDCTLKGVPAVKTVEKEYGNLNIAMAKLISPKPDAGQKKQTNESGHGKKPLTAAVNEDAQKATKKQGTKGNSRNPKDSNKNPKGNGNRSGKK